MRFKDVQADLPTSWVCHAVAYSKRAVIKDTAALSEPPSQSSKWI